MNLLARTHQLVCRKFQVEGASMEPSFHPGAEVRISPFSYLWSHPQRGDVVALRCPDHKERWELKRIVGLPGESLTWQGGIIAVNGRGLNEPYITLSPETPGDESQSLVLDVDEYFVAGDNRLHSRDSRNYGPLKRPDILGQAV